MTQHEEDKIESNIKGKEKKALKDDTQISMTYIILILAVLAALLVYIYLRPTDTARENPVEPVKSTQTTPQ